MAPHIETPWSELKRTLDPRFHPAIAPIQYILGQIDGVRHIVALEHYRAEHGTLTEFPYHPPGYDGPYSVYVPLGYHYTTKSRALAIEWFEEQGYRVRRQQRGAHLHIIEWDD